MKEDRKKSTLEFVDDSLNILEHFISVLRLSDLVYSSALVVDVYSMFSDFSQRLFDHVELIYIYHTVTSMGSLLQLIRGTLTCAKSYTLNLLLTRIFYCTAIIEGARN